MPKVSPEGSTYFTEEQNGMKGSNLDFDDDDDFTDKKICHTI
jgi:hypothetical protein